MLEANIKHTQDSTRERLDSLMALAKVGTEARAAQTQRIDGLEMEFRCVTKGAARRRPCFVRCLGTKSASADV